MLADSTARARVDGTYGRKNWVTILSRLIGKRLASALLGPLAVAVGLQPTTLAAPWIIDTDMGTDDWIALLYFARQKNATVKAITVSGNGLSQCPAARDNASSLFRLAAPNSPTPPISCGSTQSLDGYASYPQLWRQGSNNMLGQRLPAPAASVLDADLDSTALLAKTLRESTKPIKILTIGTMTNLATALIAEPALKTKIDEVVAMAGAVDTGGNVRVHGFTDDNPNQAAEWNLYIDPVAASIVFSTGIKIRLVPLDVTNKIPLTRSFADRFQLKAQSPDGRVLSNWFSQLIKPELGEYFHWDPLAAALALNPELCKRSSIRHLMVVATKDADQTSPPYGSALKQPVLNWQGKPRNILDRTRAGSLMDDPKGEAIEVCHEAHIKLFEDSLIEAFTSQP